MLRTAFLMAAVFLCCASASSFYTAAVFEHSPLESPPEKAVARNLAIYKRAAAIAKSKHADVIVFSEYGIIPYFDRQEIRPFLENVPDPQKSDTTPCSERDTYSDRPILYTLSCIAQNHSMFVVANMGDIQRCEGEPGCPSDGVFQYNTNVVFDRRGKLLVRYHKKNLFFEYSLDVPREEPSPVFETDFGTFATLVCFDLVYKRPSDFPKPIDGLMFTTEWLNLLPHFTSVQFFQSWAVGNNVTLLAANLQKPWQANMGSGIFHGAEGALVYAFNPDKVSKLLVARVPKTGAAKVPPKASITAFTEKDSWEHRDDGKDVPDECSSKGPYSCTNEPMSRNYTFVRLREAAGRVEACHNGFCCSLSYSSNGLEEEQFHLGVFSGMYDLQNTYSWCEEECVLVRCDAAGGAACGKFPLRSNTRFHNVQMRANFTAGTTIYPSAVTSGMRLVQPHKWHLNRSRGAITLSLADFAGMKLTSFGMKGRCYSKDPPGK
ncbi:pantetheinase [Caerostris extrusa]|uniref:Pantetheinase n=1 Tax=Caerostris extrusa TaxID=172846 RepID=A0AAV4WSG6_CAEEX|nr:pantetheinase [Caerostris extrusa]